MSKIAASTLLALFVGLFVAPTAVFAHPCAERAGDPSFTFVDYAALEKKSVNYLTGQIEASKNLVQELGKRKAELDVKWTEAARKVTQFLASVTTSDFRTVNEAHLEANQRFGVDAAANGVQRAIADIAILNQHIAALERAILRQRNGEASPFTTKLSIDKRIDFRGLDSRQVAKKILNAIPLDPKRLLFRYVSAARQDLLRLRGTDKSEDQSLRQTSGLHSVWDMEGVAPEDGLHALPYEDMFEHNTPFTMIEEFIRGERALAIYDLSQMEEYMGDFFVFADPSKKRQALLGIISAK